MLRGSKLPLFQKGMEIVDITNHLIDLIPEENPELNGIAQLMIEDASNLAVKVSGAEVAELYDLKMEAAAIIRRSARQLLVSTHSLEMVGFKEIYYFKVLRDAVEEYRQLFIEWVDTFDPWNYTVDRWGLFNPPGVHPNDKDSGDLMD